MPPANRFRVAILGTGVIAVPHTTGLQSLPGVELAACCDLDGAKARAFKDRWGIPQAYDNLAEMLDRVKPDAVHVLLPPTAHLAAAEQCMAAGAHVFVEKPLCISSEECNQLNSTAARYNRQVGVNHNVTFMPGVLDVLDQIQNGALGGVDHVNVIYDLPNPGLARGPHTHWMFAEPGNLMLEIGSHPLSVAYRFVGKLISASTNASGKMKLGNGSDFYHTWQSSLVCERGTAQILLSLGKSFLNTSVHVLAQDGEAYIDLARYTVRITKRSPFIRTGNLRGGFRSALSLMKQSCGNFSSFSLSSAGLRPSATWQELSIRNSSAAFYAALAAGRTVPASGVEGAAVVSACEQVVRSGIAAQELVRG